MPDALGHAQPATPRAPLQRLRSERLIAVGRILLASSSLLAIWIDPAAPVKLPAVTYALLMAYVAYSCGVAILVWRSERPSNRWRLAAHAFDLLVFTSLIYLSDGPASPFISYFVFALVCASVRWQWTGTVWTAAIALTLFLSAGIYFSLVLHDPAFKLDNFIIRGVYLAVIAVLLGQLGAHERQTLHEMSLLASWPDSEPADADEQLRGTAEHAVRILGAPRLLFVWAVRDESWLQIGYWDGSFRLGREPLASLRPLVSDRLRPLSFFTPDVTTGRVETWRGHQQQTTARAGQWINTTLQQRFSMRAVLSFPIQGDFVEGRLFFLDKERRRAEDQLTGDIVASMVTARLDRLYLTRQLERAAAAQERVRLGRDLHDGVLQAFTGVALRLSAARHLLDTKPGAAAEAIDKAQQILAHEQRDLRVFVEELNPAVSPRVRPTLHRRLSHLTDRVASEWNLQIDLRMNERANDVTAQTAREVYLIVREALVNAVRHGHASKMRVELSRAPDSNELCIVLADNGRGFPFSGVVQSGNPLLAEQGPKTLRERIEAMHGTLRITSSGSGASLDVVLPLTVA